MMGGEPGAAPAHEEGEEDDQEEAAGGLSLSEEADD